MTRRITNDEFIQQARAVHGDNYDYSKTEYVNAFTKVLIRCKRHDLWFWQEAKSHKKGVSCPRCGVESISEKLLLSPAAFLERAASVHGETYDYSKARYEKMGVKITITCRIHGDFEQEPGNHINGKQGCPRCALPKQGPQVTTSAFIEKAISVHGRKYDYSLVEYRGNKVPVTIVCPIHGKFRQTPFSHTVTMNGCPGCSQSVGEAAVERCLLAFGIQFVREFKPAGCEDERQLSYDFWAKYNGHEFLIEFDGAQHFRPIDRFGGEAALHGTQRRDAIKTRFAIDNGYRLIRLTDDSIPCMRAVLGEALGWMTDPVDRKTFTAWMEAPEVVQVGLWD